MKNLVRKVKCIKEKKGITLIALVITIVILIILAGVLINISLGNNGLFNKAKTAKEMYTNAQAQEETEIAKMTNQIDGYATFTRAGGSNINYSTQEQDTGIKWTNGETIFQKTWIIDTLTRTGSDNLIDSGFNNVNKKIISMEGSCTDKNGNICQFPYSPSDNSYAITAIIKSDGLNIILGSSNSQVNNLIMTIKYIKTVTTE